MSPRKLIFASIVVTLLLGSIIGFWILGNSKPTGTTTMSGSLNIWIVGDTTLGYDTLIEGFRAYAPEYRNAPITFKKFSDYASYQKILLSTLADGNGPDIFMVEAGADTILRDKVESIPSRYVDVSDFEKRFDDVFLPLIETSGEGTKTLSTALRGVPLGYETLGIFYNKSLIIQTAKTWNEVSMMYTDGQGTGVFPTNIGLSQRYTPFASDILGYFLLEEGITDYTQIDTADKAFDKYFEFSQTPVLPSDTTDEADDSSVPKSLIDMQESLDVSRLTTVDMFMRGEIAFIVGYPSMIGTLEDAKKRAGTSYKNMIVLTEKIPQDSLGDARLNIAKYKYFGLSKMSKNSMFGVRFLNYLATEDAERRYLVAFPHYIPAQRSFYSAAASNSLSSVFPQAKLDSFIPKLGDTVRLFQYGNKGLFESIFAEGIDRNGKIDKNNIKNTLKSRISCEIIESSGKTPPENCSL